MQVGLNTYLSLVDNWLAGHFCELSRTCIWGFSAGVMGLFIYAAASNQAAIGELKREARRCRRKLLDPTLDDAEFARLARLNLKVSLLLLARVTGPALLSALPILIIAIWMNTTYPVLNESGGMLAEFIPAWLSGWEAPFFFSVFIAALGTKLALRLE